MRWRLAVITTISCTYLNAGWLSIQSVASGPIAAPLVSETLWDSSRTSIVFDNRASVEQLFERALYGRATYGSLGVSVKSAFSASNPYADGGYVTALFQDWLTVSAVAGTPEYLAVDYAVHGSGPVKAPDYSTWGVEALFYLGSSGAYSTNYLCVGAQPHVSKPGKCEVSGVLKSNQGQVPAQRVEIPLSSIQKGFSGGPLSFFLESRLTVSYNLWPATGAVIDANYANTSLFGGLRLLDAQKNPLETVVSSNSGFDYTQGIPSSAVPEVASGWLGLMGTVALAGWRRRRSARLR